MSLEKLTLPMFLGTLVNWALFGILFIQVCIYFLAFPKDGAIPKFLVAFVFLLEILATITDTRDSARIFGILWGDPSVLDQVGWAWFSTPIMGSIIAAIGQGFFAWRIRIIARNLYVPAVIMTLIMVQMGAGIWSGVKICRAKRFSDLQTKNEKPTALWLGAMSACDIIIVASTVFYLLRSPGRQFRSTNARILRIVMITMETGLFCASLALIDLFLFARYKGTNYHMAICIGLSKAYSNSILAILNSRASIRHVSVDEISRNLNDSVMVFKTTVPIGSSGSETDGYEGKTGV